MLILRIIDKNNNNFFPQKIENFSMQKIHYGGASELNCVLEENPSFQNHKVELFNNIYLYNFSQLIWQGYITKFQRNFIKSNFTLKASGLFIDFKNKRIKKTYVLDDIGEFKNWSEKDNKESDEILYGYSQAREEKGIKISLLQRSYNTNEDGLFELKIDENIERLKVRILLNQPANFTTKLVILDGNHSNPTEEKKWENAKKVDEDVILDITKEATGSGTFTKEINPTKDSYVYKYSPDSNYGTATSLFVKGDADIRARRPFLYFPTTDIPADATIISATLYIYCSSRDDSVTDYLHRVAATWTETGITWNNQPAVSNSIGSIAVSSTGWKTMNIKTAFENWWKGTWTNYGLRMHQSGSLILHGFHSREGTYKPYIKVVYSAPSGLMEVNKRYLQFRVECIANQAISSDKYFAQLENLKLLTSDDEINAANILKDLLINHTQKLDLNTSLIQDCFNYKDIELCESIDDWTVSDADKLTLSLESSIVKEGQKSIKVIAGTGIYSFDFASDDGNWTLSDATISSGTLNITALNGYGQRSPDANWYSGSTNDFIIEYDVKLAATGKGRLEIKLVDDANPLYFIVDEAGNTMYIYYNGSTRATQGITINAGTWYSAKVRRVGTAYYFSIDSGTELSWDYGTARAIEHLMLKGYAAVPDYYDNFKYSWISSKNEYLLKTLSPVQNLQNKNLFRFWVYSTITGDILKAKFAENERMQYEPDWSCQYEADQEPDIADPAWTLTGTDYDSVSGGILTINKIGANECSYKRLDIGHNIKGNTIITRMKCDNSAKTTFLKILDGIAKVELAIYSNKIEDWNDTTNSYIVDMTKYRELWLTMKNNFFILYVDGIFALCGETQTTTDRWFKFGMDNSANLGKSYWDYVYYYNLGFLRDKRIEKTITIDVADTWEEKIIDLNNFPIETRDAIKYIQFEIVTNSAFTFYVDWIRANFEITSAYYRDRTAPINILEDVLAYQDYEWTITKDKKVKFFEVDKDKIDYICPIKNLTIDEDSVSYFNKIYLVYFDEMMKRQEIELVDENSKIPFDKEHVIGLGGISDVGAKMIGEAQFSFHKKPRYQVSCSIDNFVFDKNGGRISPVEIEPNNNVKFLGIKELPIFRIIKTDYSKDVCRLTLETEAETTPNIMKSIIGVL